jgi:hypothetical protein
MEIIPSFDHFSSAIPMDTLGIGSLCPPLAGVFLLYDLDGKLAFVGTSGATNAAMRMRVRRIANHRDEGHLGKQYSYFRYLVLHDESERALYRDYALNHLGRPLHYRPF